MYRENFRLDIRERGFYEWGQMHHFGEKILPNGNFYIGSLDKGALEGIGVLYDP